MRSRPLSDDGTVCRRHCCDDKPLVARRARRRATEGTRRPRRLEGGGPAGCGRRHRREGRLRTPLASSVAAVAKPNRRGRLLLRRCRRRRPRRGRGSLAAAEGGSWGAACLRRSGCWCGDRGRRRCDCGCGDDGGFRRPQPRKGVAAEEGRQHLPQRLLASGAVAEQRRRVTEATRRPLLLLLRIGSEERSAAPARRSKRKGSGRTTRRGGGRKRWGGGRGRGAASRER